MSPKAKPLDEEEEESTSLLLPPPLKAEDEELDLWFRDLKGLKQFNRRGRDDYTNISGCQN
jgi:hypothetical protein